MDDYTVSLSNTFMADSILDAVEQMAAWVSDYGYSAGYRISWTEYVNGIREDRSVFVDAERLMRDNNG